MEKIIGWLTEKFAHPLSFLFFLLGAILLFLGLTTGFEIPGIKQISPAADYQVVSMIIGGICLLLSIYIFYKPPQRNAKNDQKNDESPDSFLVRKALITKTQRELLEFMEKRDAILINDIHKKFISISTSELFYRLEQLKLLGFIDYERIGKSKDTFSPSLYHLSDKYRQEIKNLISGGSTTQEKTAIEEDV